MEVQPIQYAALEIDDFSGGITDNYVEGNPNKYRIADNLVLEKYGDKAKFRIRAGMRNNDTAHEHILTSGDYISTQKYFGDAGLLNWVRGHVYSTNSAGAWTALLAPDGVKCFPDPDTANAFLGVASIGSWQNHLLVAPNGIDVAAAGDYYSLPRKIYRNSAGTLQLRAAGLPSPESPYVSLTPIATPTTSGANTFLYRFCFKSAYYVGTVQYIDRSALVEISLASSASISTANSIVITHVPVLAGGVWNGFDSANLSVEIYRTVAGGVNFFLVKSVAYGTTSTSDTMTDATLLTQEPLYTEGGVVENDPPPLARVVHICADTGIAYYADFIRFTSSATEQLKYVVAQSVPGDFDSCPADFELELDDNIMGLSSIQDRVLALGTQNAYRIDGAFDLLGRGGMVGQKISDRADCVSAQSVVQTLIGIFWCGTDYFYWSNGYQVLPINLEWTKTHKSFTAAYGTRIQGKYDRAHNRVWWSVVSQGSTSNDKCYILDLNFSDPSTNQWAFTSASYTGTACPTAFEFVGKVMYSGDANSNVFYTSEDLREDSSLVSGMVVNQPILFEYESVAFNLGNSSIRKISPRMAVKLKQDLDTSGDYIALAPLAITSINDLATETDLKPVNIGTSEMVFSGYTPTGLIAEERRFAGSAWRYSLKQIRLSNAKIPISNNSLTNRANVTVTPGTSLDGTIHMVSAKTWPTNLYGYKIALSNDSYVNEFTITAVNSSNDTLTVSDPSSLLPNSPVVTLGWVIRGYLKNATFGLVSYTVDYAHLGKTQHHFRKSQTGEPSS